MVKAPKITEQFPLTMPVIAANNPGLPLWLIRKLLPAPHHWSGTTPRWAEITTLPNVTHAVTFKSETREPLVEGVYTLGESNASKVCGFFIDEKAAKAAQREFIVNFWPHPTFRLRESLAEICRKHGGFSL